MGESMESERQKQLAGPVFTEARGSDASPLSLPFFVPFGPMSRPGKAVYFGIIVILLWSLSGCSPETKALKNFKFGNHESVIAYYQTKLKSEPNNGKANF